MTARTWLVAALALTTVACGQRQLAHTAPTVHLAPGVEATTVLESRYVLLPLVRAPYSLRWSMAWQAAGTRGQQDRRLGVFVPPRVAEDALLAADAWTRYRDFAARAHELRAATEVLPSQVDEQQLVVIRGPAAAGTPALPSEVVAALSASEAELLIVPVLHTPTSWTRKVTHWYIAPPVFFATYDESYLGDVVVMDFLLMDGGTGELVGAVTGVLANERDAPRTMARALRAWREAVAP